MLCLVSDLNAVMRPQVLAVLGSGSDHPSVDHRLIGFDVWHDERRPRLRHISQANLYQLAISLYVSLTH